ncbi:Hypothetical predicted protein [Olea europaea subsp. europaea]|uniref:Uncharacterized protein n=1 Tax=Olea europaea subsp. europaea TaxID=158383 RepID=A0A8S0TDF0_OLEEU|nr:Hypothetical predicted protein [Olea europaea subsp. europaea]
MQINQLISVRVDSGFITVPKRRWFMVSIKTQQVGYSSKSCEILKPRNELIHTPRHITRSINVLSQWKDFDDCPLNAGGVRTNTECLGKETHMNDTGFSFRKILSYQSVGL